MKVVPELLCTDIEATGAFYTDVLGFEVKYERRSEGFVYFSKGGVDIMCEELAGVGRRWISGEMRPPFGRGINLQWDVTDASALYQEILSLRPDTIYMPLEQAEYECGDEVVRQTQFVVQDPDGYLFRFCNH